MYLPFEPLSVKWTVTAQDSMGEL